ncbi:MAG: carboxymuconolactone decarboxylase family protein [Solirubrobacteraceae bacterium]
MGGPDAAPRIPPGELADIGVVNFALTRVLGAATGGGPPNVFTTLARHRKLFRRWLRFAGTLMPGGLLPREESELVILRVAHNCRCEYEWQHHERFGRLAGLSPDEIERVRQGPDAAGWSPRRSLLLAAADELHAERRVSDALWSQLAGLLGDRELIELCLLTSHYEMLAMTINSLRLAPDALPSGSPSALMRVGQKALGSRRRRAAAVPSR